MDSPLKVALVLAEKPQQLPPSDEVNHVSTTEYARSEDIALDATTGEAPPPKDARWVRLSVNLDPAVLEALKELARRNGTTITEMVRRAISDEKYFQDAADRGAQILIKEDGREVREVVFR